jgi:hypothetical protein
MLAKNLRLALLVKNLKRLSAEQRTAIAARAQTIRATGGAPPVASS